MAWGFRKRAGLFGGLLRLNVSKHGVGASVGAPGLRVGINNLHRPYVRGGIPGTGLFFSEQMPSHLRHTQAPARQVGFLACLVCAVFAVIWIATVYFSAAYPAAR